MKRIRDFCLRLDSEAGPPEGMDAFVERFFDSLADDFNTAAARAALFEWIADANRRLDAGERFGPGRLAEVLGVIGMESLLASADGGAGSEAERLADEREEARAKGDWETADRKRDELAELGFEVRDTPDGPQLVRRP